MTWLTNRRLFLIALATMLPVGCSSTPTESANDYVGEYVFRPSNVAPGDFAGFLILKPGQTAVEIRFSKGTGQIQTSEKKWYLSRTTGENVVIGDRSYPIDGKPPDIRLQISEVGLYYEKVR